MAGARVGLRCCLRVLRHRIGSAEATGSRCFATRFMPAAAPLPFAGRYVSNVEADVDSGSSSYFYDFENVCLGEIVDDSDDDFRSLWGRIEATHMEVLAVDILKQWVRDGNHLRKDLVNSLLLKLCSRLWAVEALRITEWLDKQKLFLRDEADELLRLEILCRSNHWPEAQKKLKSMSATQEAYLIVLMNYANKGMTFKLESLMEEMKNKELLRTPRAYAPVFRMYSRDSQFRKAYKLLQEFEASGLSPDAGMLWNLLRHKQGFRGYVDAEEKVREALPQLKLERGNRRELLRLHAVLERSEGVEEIWRQIRASPPVKASEYVTAMHSFSSVGRLDKVMEISRELEGAAGGISYEHAEELLRIFSRRGMVKEAEGMHERIVQSGRKVDGLPGFFMVKCCLKVGRFDEAVKRYHGTLDAGERAYHPMSVLAEVMEALNHGYAERCDVGGAERMMGRAPHIAAPWVFASLLKVYIRAKTPAYGMESRMAALRVEMTPAIQELLSQHNSELLNKVN